jgi:hypothetical protein
MLTQTTRSGRDVEFGAAVPVTDKAEAEAEAGTDISTAIASVDQVLRTMITDDRHLGARHPVRNRRRLGGSRRTCIRTDGVKEKEIGHHMLEALMAEGGQVGEGVVITWKGA